MKKKTYVIMLAKQFPATHPKKGEPTFFRDKVLAAVFKDSTQWRKLHTIRENCPLWEERIRNVIRGDAVISLRQWTGAPYRSKTTEITRLSSEDGVGVQRLNFVWYNGKQLPVIDSLTFFNKHVSKAVLAENDGLSLKDWADWFKGHDSDTVDSKPLAIIHFTKFRY